MPSPWRQLWTELGERVDEELLPRLYEAASLRTDEVREELDGLGVRRFDPSQPDLSPTAFELEESCVAVIRRAGRSATLRGAVAGAAGLPAIPPEALVALVQLLHLAQRLAVIYGHDPESGRGRVLLLRALSEALEFKLPRQARLDFKVSDLPRVVEKQLPDVAHRGAWLARILAVRTAVSVAGRVGRVVPGVGAGLAAYQARTATRTQGERMAAVFRRAWTGEPFVDGPIEDAVELPD